MSEEIMEVVRATRGDNRAYVESIDKARNALIMAVDSNTKVPDFMRGMVCAIVNYGVNRIIAWVYAQQCEVEAGMRNRRKA